MQFSSKDAAWINSNPIKFGSKELGCGVIGRVYELDNNPNLVIKVPKLFFPQTPIQEKFTSVDKRTAITRPFILKEIENYNYFKNLSIIVPTMVVKLGVKTASGEDYLGLVRPKLNTSFETLSDKQILDLRDMLIELSEAGCMLRDSLQVGLNNSGRPQIYDLGTESISYHVNRESVYSRNNSFFSTFLNELGISGYNKLKPS